MKNKYAIVISAYNRAEPLNVLLESLNATSSIKNVPLIISIDNSGTEAVNKVAESFIWRHGEKRVIIHEKKKGLREHFIWCGDQTEYYENVLFLEDDLYVSPFVGEYVNAVIDSYKEDDRIAGAALYSPLLCEFSMCKFFQIEDGYDNYFFQHPYWGNVWFKEQWRKFKLWLNTYEYKPEILPKRVQQWNHTSFKKLYIQFLIETGRYIVYPRVSYVTNMGEKGLHSKSTYLQFQVALQNGSKNLRFSSLDESISVYDGYFELSAHVIKRVNPQLSKIDFTVDINGLRDNYTTEYVITRKKVDKYRKSFSNEMRPIEQALLSNVEGDGLYLADVSDLKRISGKIWTRFNKIDDIVRRNYTMGIKDIFSVLLFVIKK